MRHAVLLFVFATLAVTGCKITYDNELVGTRWVLEEATFPPADPTVFAAATLRLPDEARIDVDGCNACSGGVRIDGRVLDLGSLGCTEIACGDRLDLGPRLAEADRIVYSLSNDGLVLVATEGEALSTFTFVDGNER